MVGQKRQVHKKMATTVQGFPETTENKGLGSQKLSHIARECCHRWVSVCQKVEQWAVLLHRSDQKVKFQFLFRGQVLIRSPKTALNDPDSWLK